MRQHIPVSALRLGQRVYVEPQRDGIPRGPKLQGSLKAGEATINAWLFDLIRRGQLRAFTEGPEIVSADELKLRAKEIGKANAEIEEQEATRLEGVLILALDAVEGMDNV